ncbi:hypothetical protein NDU88_001807 [Pleurodeles waltl]|uniref:Uncharacterized protein n=1 Tax=Pleurodeles waltl TaxID=8319 RepID=A0AAV7Q756_PLEWA|nr:hypothetical protein NDU88_001807 [Pleurodeles waltl]
MLRASFLIPQRYFLPGCAGLAPTLPADRAFRRALSAHGRFVRCTVAYSPPGREETAPQRPLQVPWGCAPCLVPHSPVLLPRYGCRARTVTAGGLRTPLRPQHTRALYPMHCSVFSAKSGQDRPSTSSSGKRWSRRQDRVTTRVPGLGDGRKPRSSRLQRGPPRSGIGLPLVPLDPRRLRVPTLQVDVPRKWAVFKD